MIKIKNSFSFFYHWHQRIGLVMAIAVIAWALSGLAHPIISFINPKPVSSPPKTPLQWQELASVEDLIARQGIQRIASLRVFQWQDLPVYRINSEQGIAYFSARDLTPIAQGDQRYAQFMAQHFSGDPNSTILAVTPVEQFDKDYLYINRYLPVMRVDFARTDQARVYIDTEQGRLATIVDRNKAITGAFFRSLHSWTWIESILLRKMLMCIFLVLGFLTAVFGLTLYIKSWKLGIFRKDLQAHQHHPLSRRLHRHLGAAVAIFVMAFCSSGLLHLLTTDKINLPQQRMLIDIDAQSLRFDLNAISTLLQRDQIEDIQLTKIGDKSYWQLKEFSGPVQQRGEHDHHQHANNQEKSPKQDAVRYLDTRTGKILDNGWQKHAIFLAAELTGYSTQNIKQVRLLENFNDEYGFVNKRLPVHAVDFDMPGSPTIYVEASTGTLASSVATGDRIEGYSFAYLHKWHFIDFLGKNTRDILTSITALAIMIVLLLGVYRYWATRARRRRS